MSDSPEITIKVSSFISPTALQQRLLNIIGDDEVKTGVNKIIGERANKYVPMKTGALRASMKVTPDTISWGSGLDYAHYQHEGIVYGRNYPIISDGILSGFFTKGNIKRPKFFSGVITGWYSLPGVSKVPTDRKLGTPGEYMGWTFGYSTPETHSDWVNEMLRREKRSMSIQITNYLKREAKRRNI